MRQLALPWAAALMPALTILAVYHGLELDAITSALNGGEAWVSK